MQSSSSPTRPPSDVAARNLQRDAIAGARRARARAAIEEQSAPLLMVVFHRDGRVELSQADDFTEAQAKAALEELIASMT